MRLTRRIQKEEMDMYNPTRSANDKFVETDYACKRSAYDRDILNKLGQLEDIEDELGIDLNILFYALEKGIYARLFDYTKPTFKKVMIEQYHIDIRKKYIDIRRYRLYGDFNSTGGHLYHFKDYGKTWALTKEELYETH